MKYHILYHINSLAVSLLLFCACSDVLVSSDTIVSEEQGEIITVGADVDDLEISSTVTRAAGETQAAERVSWLVQPLKQGLDITYGNIINGSKLNERVAILKLLPADGGTSEDNNYKTNAISGYAEYTFNYRSASDGAVTSDPARWYDNGLHYFEGVHVPNRIRYNSEVSELSTQRTINDVVVAAVNNLTTDQSKDNATGSDDQLDNYVLLSHYLGMPANTQIAATVARIKLPFRHRLARVLAYILIDPSLKTNGVDAKINGYSNIETDATKPFKDDPTTSSIRFCNVDVLEGVHDVYNATTKLHTLTPKWAEKVRKVVPHFEKQLAEFKTYESEKKTYYEGSSDFPSSRPSGFTEIVYKNVPVYDLIVRPTYTSENNVMYDEDLGSENSASKYAAKKNQIDFTVSLDNGLTYEKHFEFDLDANYQTIVYLKITREGVDYNESGSQTWVESTREDLWYGLDNLNGHNLSEAGSSWQRAYYNTRLSDSDGDKITDGGFYDENTTGEDGTTGQYVSSETWIKNFSQAYSGGTHHGDYFVLANDITIDARSLPDDFVFTGHLDGFNTHSSRGYYTITVTNTGQDWKEYIESTDYTSAITRYATKPEDAYSNTEVPAFSLPANLYTKTHYDAVYYTQDECNTHNQTLDGAWNYESEIKTPAVEEVKYTEEEIAEAIAIVSADDYVTGTNPEAEIVATKTKDDVKIPAQPAVFYDETECNAHNAELPNAWSTSTEKTPAKDEYTAATPSLYEVMTGSVTYFTQVNDVYTEYVKPTVLYEMKQHTSGSALFAGLDGIYTTAQETASDSYSVKWEANVHKEGNYWLPYRDVGEGKTNTGWRAEVMNLKVNGCPLFKEGANISGNVQNCQYKIGDAITIVLDHIPAYPKYK